MTPWVLVFMALGWQDGRPAICDGGEGTTSSFGRTSGDHHAGNLWERAKAPTIVPYCARLATVIASLSNPTVEGAASSLVLLAEADSLLPQQGMTEGLRAWAKFEEGALSSASGRNSVKFAEGYALLKKAEKLDPRVGDEPRVSLVFARLAAAAGPPAEAMTRYEQALGRSAKLPPRLRSAAYFEAGMLALAIGPSTLPRAIAILREGLRSGGGGYEVSTQLGLALALGVADRAAEGVMLERVRGTVEPEAMQSLALLGRKAEGEGLRALGLEGRDPAAAKAAWARAADEHGPWEAYARAREAKVNAKRKPGVP